MCYRNSCRRRVATVVVSTIAYINQRGRRSHRHHWGCEDARTAGADGRPAEAPLREYAGRTASMTLAIDQQYAVTSVCHCIRYDFGQRLPPHKQHQAHHQRGDRESDYCRAYGYRSGIRAARSTQGAKDDPLSSALHDVGFRSEIIERQLAHQERSKTKRSYNRALYLEERRQVMQNVGRLSGSHRCRRFRRSRRLQPRPEEAATLVRLERIA
jgi:hypothetical protein